MFDGVKRKGRVLLLAFAAVVIAIYLLYSPFPEWWYLRFLIPAIVALLILASAVERAPAVEGQHGRPDSDRRRGARHHRHARRRRSRRRSSCSAWKGAIARAAELVRDRLPANAVLITVWQSGSMRFHAGREIVMWDSLDPAWLDRAITWLRSQGQQPYLLFERREEPEFRARFRDQSEIGASRLAAAIRSQPPGAGFTIPPIARVTSRASRIRPRTCLR